MTVRRRRGGWQVIVYAGINPKTGRQRQVTRQVNGSKRAAEQEEARLITEVAQGRHQGTGATTLAELLDVWFEWRTSNGKPLSPATRNDYESMIATKIKPALGKLRLPKVNALTLDRFYRELASHGRTVRVRDGMDPETGKPRWRTEQAPLSASRVHQVHAVLSGALGLAARYGWLPFNPAALATPPGGNGQQRPTATPAQVREVMRAAKRRDPAGLYLFLRIAATTGLRPGEIVALRWCDVDLYESSVRVTGNIVHTRGLPPVSGRRGGYVRKDTKSVHGDRRLALDARTAALLRAYRRYREAQARSWGGVLADDAYLFASDEAGRHPVRRDSMGKQFRELAAELGHGYTLYGFRHFMASQLGAVAAAGTVRDRMGHGSLAVTGGYMHPVTEADREAARYMSELLAGRGKWRTRE